MACTAQTAKKTTGGLAKHLMLACLEAASPPTKRARLTLTLSSSDVLNCSLCEEGGDLFECDMLDCHRAVCTRCIDIPVEMLDTVKSPSVRFCCVSCHWAACRHNSAPYIGFTENGKPVLSSFLNVRGTFQGSTKATMYTVPTLLLHFRLASVHHHAHFNIIKELLRDYYPLAWPNHAGEIISRIHATCFKRVVAVVTNHTDDDRSDFWLGSDEDGSEPGAVAVDEWMDLVLGPFKDVLQGSIMYFVLCGAVVRNQEAFAGLRAGLKTLGVNHALAFDALHLSPVKTIDLLMQVTKSVVLHDFKFTEALEHALRNASALGKHSAIIHIASKVTKYVWSHKDYQPWGTMLPLQCPQCGVLSSWCSVYMPGGLGGYRFQCKGKTCGWVQDKKAIEPHQIEVPRPPEAVLLDDGWLKFELA
ncbi:hypothetical protein JVT61DRAFT_14436 [Boletus reticuloceps]|uniref:Uncharacterized protein n=1 Tax=Boletus reticuloceps TaxID=495285 RepID=A0A8I2YT55_9AGAM|nr:hypothetical protein JVT61DRAFT_14436 [Boletus reticuloceps]